MKPDHLSWSTEEWDAFYPQLEKLTQPELAEIASRCGLRFVNHENTPKRSLLGALDECDQEELKRVYREIVARRHVEQRP